jgi:hypothetical protein
MNLAEAYKKAKKSGPSPEIENVLSQDARYSFFYAKEVVKGRWELGENAIIQDTYFSFLYAKDVLKNKLPEPMHNKMIAYAIKDPTKYFTQQYFEFIKIYG